MINIALEYRPGPDSLIPSNDPVAGQFVGISKTGEWIMEDDEGMLWTFPSEQFTVISVNGNPPPTSFHKAKTIADLTLALSLLTAIK